MLSLGACSERAQAPPSRAVQTISDFVLTETQRGATQWILRSREATLRDAAGAQLLEPRIEVYQDGRPAAQVRSRSGTYEDSTRDMRLRGDVVAVSRDEDSRDPTVLKTDALDYLNAEQQFKTDRPVLIERGGSVMRGKGLVANRDLSEIRVLHEEADIR